MRSKAAAVLCLLALSPADAARVSRPSPSNNVALRLLVPSVPGDGLLPTVSAAPSLGPTLSLSPAGEVSAAALPASPQALRTAAAVRPLLRNAGGREGRARPSAARQLNRLSFEAPERQGLRFDAGREAATSEPVAVGFTAGGIRGALAASEGPAPEPGALPPPEPPRRPPLRPWAAAQLGIFLSTILLLGVWSLPPSIAFYSIPTAFTFWAGLAALGWIARRLTGKAPSPRTAGVPLSAAAWGAVAGLCIAVFLPFAYSGAAVGAAAYTFLAALLAAGFISAGGQGVQALRTIKRLIWGGDDPLGKPLRLPKRLELFRLGLGAGLIFAVTPRLEAMAPALVLGYGIFMALCAVAALWVFAELLRIACAVKGVAAGTWRPRALRGYALRLLLGAGLAAAPLVFVGPFVVAQSRVIERAASTMTGRSRLMRALPAGYRWTLRFLAERREVRAIPAPFAEEAVKVLSANPQGRALLEKLRGRDGRLHMPSFFLSNQPHSGAYMSPLADGVFLNPAYVKAAGWTMEEFLADPGKQRELARRTAQIIFHELVHAEQARRMWFYGPVPVFFPGQFKHFPNQLTAVPHIQLEYEAHIREQLFVHEALKADPKDPNLEVNGYKLFLEDLDAFLADIRGSLTYEAFSEVDAELYEKFLSDIRARLPTLQEEGHALLARRWTN